MSVIKPQEINLDFTQNSYKDITVKQNDVNSRTVIITCTNNGVKCPLDKVAQTCNIRMETPSGTPIYNPTTILSDGRVQIDFTEQMVLESGKVNAELEVIDANLQEIIHTMNLHIIVVGNVCSNDAITASPEFDALNKALLAVQDCSELVESVHQIEENERQREENELQRAQEFEEMRNVVSNVDEHYNSIASTDILGHVKVDGVTIVVDENGVISGANSISKVSELENDSGYIITDELPDEIVTFSMKTVDYTDSIYEAANIVNQAAGYGSITKELYPYIMASHFSMDYSVVYFAKSVEDDTGSEYIIIPDGLGIEISGINGPLVGSDISDIFVRIIQGINNEYVRALGAVAQMHISTVLSKPIYTNFDLRTIKPSATRECYILIGEEPDYGTTGQHIITNGDGTIGFVDGTESGEFGFNDVYAEDTLNLGRAENSVVGEYSATIGYYNKATGYAAVAEGVYVEANGSYSHAEGRSNVASGSSSHAEGEFTKASGDYSHAEGWYSQATASYSHAEGYSTVASQYGAHAEGDDTNATGQAAHAEGNNTEASGSYSHAEGSSTKATQGQAHAEGVLTIASGYNSHAEGSSTEAKGSQSHAEGSGTIASGNNQHTQGMYNIEDTENKYAHIVGGGENNTERKNIHTLDWEGNAVFAGNVTDGNGDSIASVKTLIQAGGATDEQVQTAVESYLSENPIESGGDYSPTVKAVNHRGYSAGAPENTLPAYVLSKKKGFKYAECDVAFTSDGIAVLLHDDTIDRTSDGSGSISSLTYEQLLTYDFGSWFSSEYAGTKIPTFEEFIKLCKHIDLHPYIELKSSGNYTQEQIASIVDVVKANGMKGKVTYISFNSDFLKYVKSTDANARLGYLSSTATDSVITTVTSLRSGSNEVYAGVNYTALTDNFISNCIVDSIPLEIWTVNDVGYIRNMNSYISGVTSDSLIAGDILRSEYINSVGTIGFPTDENGTANHGVAGQFLISNGDGTVAWASIAIAEGGAF